MIVILTVLHPMKQTFVIALILVIGIVSGSKNN